jgi:hypothetical protein
VREGEREVDGEGDEAEDSTFAGRIDSSVDSVAVIFRNVQK